MLTWSTIDYFHSLAWGFPIKNALNLKACMGHQHKTHVNLVNSWLWAMPLKVCPSSWQWQEVGDQDVTWIVMFSSDPKLHPQFKPWGHGTKSYANSNSVMIGGSTMKISVTIDFKKIKHNSKKLCFMLRPTCASHMVLHVCH